MALCVNRNTPRKDVWRAEIVLATADGCGTSEIMRRAGTSKPTVWRWQARYLDEGIEGLQREKTRPSRVPPLPRETRLTVITKTVKETPPDATHWSRATMAAAAGISPSSVGRIWAEAGPKPHLTKGFKVSNDPQFEAKVMEIVGLYLDPPERAVVLCVDEKSQIQALDRTQPGLPLKKGRAATMTHDYKRRGTTTLFAALDVKSGMVIGECMPCRRAKEFLAFLRRIDRAVLKPRDIHIVLDNYATHKTPEVQAWLEKHPRFKLHFTPTSASWMNLVERFFAEITNRRIRRGSYDSVNDLEDAIYDYLLLHIKKPKPFVWTKSAENILTRERRALDKLDEIRGNRKQASDSEP
ncbi:IS630 family transposase [Rhodovulum marinum]|uniref:Transposase n=1 Tax=Rhodovulum marinum TaxID=320662 RepID=A0A4V2SQ40_9RHOB|nr:IS630 family transposase [Rhodovulum marinum]TCP37596.1 transposase [Rhodovulum marinum]